MIVCESYLEYLRNVGCLVCPKEPDVHHLLARGWRESKRDDFTGIPLCREHHVEIEQVGASRFEETYKMNMWQVSHHLLRKYLGALRKTHDVNGLLGRECTAAEGKRRGS